MQQNSSKRPRDWVRGDQRANVRRRTTWSEEKGESFFESLRVFHEKKPDGAMNDDMLNSLAHNTALFRKNMNLRNAGRETDLQSTQRSDTGGVQGEHTGRGNANSKASHRVRHGSSRGCKERRDSRSIRQKGCGRHHRASSTATASSDDLEIVGTPSLETKQMVRDLGKYVADVQRKQTGRHRSSGTRKNGKAATSASSSSSNVNRTCLLSHVARGNSKATNLETGYTRASSGDSSGTDSSLPKSQSSLDVTLDDWREDEEQARRSFRASVVSQDDMSQTSTPPLVRAFRAYNLRPRAAGKTYRDTSTPAAPVLNTTHKGRERKERKENREKSSKVKARHECPCHNTEICIRMLQAANEPELAARVRNANRTPRMTSKLLSVLYPEHERLDDQELLGHRVVIDEDQAVHETAPYAYHLNGWPREVGGYDLRINALAKKEDMDVVDAEVELLLELYQIGAGGPCVIDLTRDSDEDEEAAEKATESRPRRAKRTDEVRRKD